MNIIIFGPPGSGKGTQASILADKLSFTHISTGDILRSMKNNNLQISQTMNAGGLVPDEIVMKVLEDYLVKMNLFDNIIFDGSPRSLLQYRLMKNMLSKKESKIDMAIYLKISDETVIKRLTSRRMDKITGKIYNLITNPPGSDVNPANLIQRDDDKFEAVKKRLEVQKPSENMIEEIKKDGIFYEVDGEVSIEEIFSHILKLIEEKKHE